MRTIIFQLAFLVLTFTAKAQKYSIQPLPCGVWGKENWTEFTEEDLEELPRYVNLEHYDAYEGSNEILFLTQDEGGGYINNLQCIRWSLQESEEPFKVTVSENGERIILYEAETKGCGLILFPDSLIRSIYSTLEVVVERENRIAMQFSFSPDFKSKRKEVLAEMHTCAEIKCQVGTLIQNRRYREALSLMEIERMKNPLDTELKNIYWRAASKIRLYSGLPFSPVKIKQRGWCYTP